MSDIRDSFSTVQEKDTASANMQAVDDTMQVMNDTGRTYGNMSRQQLLNQINQVSFAVNDMQLYLDTHPNCQEGLRFMQRHLERRQRLLDLYAENYGPLTMDSMEMAGEDSWKWMKQPFPLKHEGGCR